MELARSKHDAPMSPESILSTPTSHGSVHTVQNGLPCHHVQNGCSRGDPPSRGRLGQDVRCPYGDGEESADITLSDPMLPGMLKTDRRDQAQPGHERNLPNYTSTAPKHVFYLNNRFLAGFSPYGHVHLLSQVIPHRLGQSASKGMKT